jgi:hypothetical protein
LTRQNIDAIGSSYDYPKENKEAVETLRIGTMLRIIRNYEKNTILTTFSKPMVQFQS